MKNKAKLNSSKVLKEMKARGLNQSKLALILGMSRQGLSYALKKKSLYRVYDFAKFFKLDIKDLIE